jgi:ABC-2 type transport system ATP-binding protein
MMQIKNLHFSYGTKKVLDGLDLEWHLNAIHGIMGANGSGKSTFFKILKGLLNPEKGELRLGETFLDKRDIAFLPTDPVFYPRMKGSEYLEFFRIQNKAFDIKMWNTIMELPLDKTVDSYSTGMKKKLALLGCLALDKKILLLDEPFNGLDSDAFQIAQEILLRQRELGKTIILSSHISHSLSDICDDIAHLDMGVISKKFQKESFKEIDRLLFAEKRELVRKQLRF